MFNPKVLDVCQIMLSSLTHVSICHHIHCVAYTLDTVLGCCQANWDARWLSSQDAQCFRPAIQIWQVQISSPLPSCQIWDLTHKSTTVVSHLCLCMCVFAPWPESGSLTAHRSVCQSIWCVATIRNKVRRSVSVLADVRCARLAQVGFRKTRCAPRSSFYSDPETPAAAKHHLLV